MSVSTLRRPRRVVAGMAAALVSAGVLIAGATAPAAAAPDTAAAPDAVQSASEKAQDTGEPVPITELTDSFTTVTAQPDGTFQKDVSNVPERIHRSDTWVNVDATLHSNSDGSLSPAASYTPLTLSGGGDGSLAVLHHDQSNLSLSWPTSLPAPTVSGDTATYADVLPGVDLRVTADTLGGMSDVLVVKTAEAAANPALKTLTLGTQASSGLSVQADAGNNVTVLDAEGHAVFHSPAPMMWDSTTTATANAATADSATVDGTDPADGPGPGAKVQPVEVQADDDAVTLTPDPGLLTGSTTHYPVYIDPAWTDGPSFYAWVQQAWPDNGNWDTTDNGEPAVGYCGWDTCVRYGITRSFFQFHAGSLTGTHVISAYFKVSGVSGNAGSASCTDAHPMVVNSTDMIDHLIHWGNEPALWSEQDTANAYNGYGDCPNRTTSFNVTSSAQADNGQGTLTYRIRAQNEGDRNDYMRFNHAASLTLNYNKIPNVPTDLAFSPSPQNPSHTTYDDTGWIGATANVSIAAHVSDPDGSAQNITGQFHLWDKGASGTDPATDVIAWTDSAGQTSEVSGKGGTVSIRVPASKLKEGHKYGADARASDGIDTSGVTDYQYFQYDATAPENINVTSTDFPKTGDEPGDKQVGDDGVFTLTGQDPKPAEDNASASGLDHFAYSTSSAADIAGDGGEHKAADANGTAELTLPQTVWGINYLYVAGVDKAGNQSTTFTYRYYVPDDPEAPIQPGDVDNDGNPDLLATNTNGNLELYDSTPTAPEKPTVASTGLDSPNGTSWADVLIAHRSSSQHSISTNKVDDLWAHQENDTELYAYVNNLNKGGLATNSGHYFTYNHAYPVTRPKQCADSDCTGYNTTDWSHVTQLIAPGDLDGDDNPDLLTVEDGILWLFPGDSATGVVRDPHKLGDTYADTRLVAPGDATGDGIPDLWSFDDDHTVNTYLVTVGIPKDPTSITITRKSDDDPNFDSTQRPLIASPGDVNGDGLPDVYTTVVVAGSEHQQLWANMGETIGDQSPDLTGHSVVDDTQSWEDITHLS